VVCSEKLAPGRSRRGASGSRAAVGLAGLGGWSVSGEAAGHRWLLGFPLAFQLALGAAALVRGASHVVSPGWSGVCARGRDAGCLRARDAQFGPEPVCPARVPAGKGDGDAQLLEQGNVCATLIQI